MALSVAATLACASEATTLPNGVQDRSIEQLSVPRSTHAAAPAVEPNAGSASRSAVATAWSQRRAPHLNAAAYQTAAFVRNAKFTVGPSNASGAPPAPTAADLAESDEVVLTPAIRAQAAALNNNPVAIYNWVRDHIAYAPTYGSMQNADVTLQFGRGNAFDTASLLVALLRAGNISARYVYGTIEVPAPLVQNWVGGVITPDAAVSLLGQGGIPVEAIVSGGTISALQLEHVWVEAYVDFNPSRGAVNRTPTTWVPMDAAFKQYRYTAGLPVHADVTIDASALATQIQQGATVSADRVTALNAAPLNNAYSDFATRASAYIGSRKPSTTVGDVLGTQTIVREDLPILAGALPYKTVALGARYTTLPDDLRWQLQFGVYATEFDRSQDNALVGIHQSLARIGGKRLTLSFPAASAGDKTQLDHQLDNNPLPTSVSGLAVHTAAQLTLDGQSVSRNGDLLLGAALVGGVGIFDPRIGDWTYAPSAHVIAGETHTLSATGGGVSPAMLTASRNVLIAQRQQLSDKQYNDFTQDTLVGAVLNDTALAYAATVGGTTDLLCKACGIVGTALPTIVRVHTSAAVTTVNGLPQSVSFPAIALNVEMLGRTGVTPDNNTDRARAFQRLFGARASAYAHLLLDALFTDSTHFGRTASAVRALDAANTSGQSIFLINAANSAATLPQLTLDTNDLSAVRDGVQAGRSAVVSQSSVRIGNWNGAGYLLEDPTSGSGDYEVSGHETAVLDTAGGWLPLALASDALAVQGDATAIGVEASLDAHARYTGAAIALLSDYTEVPWATFVAATSVVSDWWLCALSDGLTAMLGAPVAGVINLIGVDQQTTLPGTPQPNNAPYFTSTPVVSAAVGHVYQYAASATDPDGDAVTFSAVDVPDGMTMSAAGFLTWASPVTGSYHLTLRVSDGTASADQTFVLTVGQVLPLSLGLGITPAFVNDGDTITISVATTGGSGQVSKSLTVDGAGIALDTNGQATLTAHGAGAHAVVATAADNQTRLNVTGAFGVRVASDTAPPTVAILAPADSDTLTAPVTVIGTVTDTNLLSWNLLVSPAGQSQWTELNRGTQAVSNGALGLFDPTQLPNGQYDLAVFATDVNGAQSSQKITVLVYGDLKLGQFAVSFNDLQLDVGGIPLTIVRTYDSRKKDIQGDFGYGWSLGYQNVNLQRSEPLGEQWQIYQPGFITFCIRPIGKRTVSIAMADGKVHQFDIDDQANCATGQVPDVFSLAFKPRPGTTSTLEALDAVDLLFQGNTVYDGGSGDVFDSFQYRLTTLENYQYLLTSHDGAKTFQLVQITDPNGETLTLSAHGATSSVGAAISFQRDAQGRIVSVTDPANRSVAYAYTASGDLESITSPLHQISHNQYASMPARLSHLLTSYIDAAGTQQLRNEYDTNGKLIAQYDALGNKVDLSQRNLDTHIQAITDRNGNTTTYTFDDAGNITNIVDAVGGNTSATFDAFGNQLSQTDPLGRMSKTTYDSASGTVLTQVDALGNTTTSDWNFFTLLGNHTPQNLKSTTDALGNTTTYSYTNSGMLSGIIDPLGHTTQFGWGGTNFDQLTQLSDAAGNKTTYQNDSLGRKTQETDPLGNVTKYTYDTAGHLLTTSKSRVLPSGVEALITTRSVDADGNVISQTDALGNTTQSTWTVAKQLASQTDAMGRVTSYNYDATGRPTKTMYPDGSTESTAYDANGNATRQVDRAAHSIVTAFDALNRPTSVTNADGTTTSTTYDAAGQVIAVVDELGRSSASQYDAAGRKTQRIDAAGNATTYIYDAVGQLTKTTDPLGHVVQYTYDAAHRKTQTTWPEGSISKSAYDAAGRKTQDTDPAKRSTQFAYDANGRLNEVTDALGKVTTYGYDEQGNKTQQTDALSRGTQWTYDAVGHATSRSLPDGRFETMAHDAVGRQTNRTDFAGDATGYQYDLADRLTQQLFVDGSVIATTYTPSDQVASLTFTPHGGNATIANYRYDTRDRLTDITNPDGSTLHYVYDGAGQRTQEILTTPDGAAQTTDFAYDLVGNLATVTTDGKTFTYTYDSANRKIERDDPNGNVTAYTYDANGRLTGWTTTQGSGPSAPVLQQGIYTLNAAGQRTQLVYVAPDGQTRTINYTYDGAGKLIGESQSLPAHTTTWTLDAVGNRTAQTQDGQTSTYTYDSTDRLIAITGSTPTTYTWDAKGQLASKTVGSGAQAQTTTYTFDARHELIQAQLPDGTKIDYRYQADGNLAYRTKTLPDGTATTTHYLVDPNLPFAQVVAEYDDAGHATATYTYGDELLQRTRAGQGTYYNHDGLGRVTALTDESGAAIQTYGTDAWGNPIETVGTDDNPYQFTGERYDADLGLVYLRARWYEPVVGRFVSQDQANGMPKLPISLNRYLYANSDPANNIDPQGTETLGDIGAGLDIQGILTNIAKDQISSFVQNQIFGCPDEDNGQPCLFDVLMAQLIRAIAGSQDDLEQSTQVAGVTISVLGGPRHGEKHHAVPKYMCGHESQELVYLPVPQHKKLHSELYNFKQKLNIAGGVYKVAFKRKVNGISLVADMAKRRGGRTAIVAGLSLFYYLEGYNGTEWATLGSGVKSHLPLGYVFPIEAARYELNHYNKGKCPDDDDE